MFREEFLHFIWEHKLYLQDGLRTTCGRKLEVMDPGKRNIHAGPDFICARLRAGQLVWVGNVEIHACSSDWKKHGHHVNPAYNNVILHVVNRYRGEVWNSLGHHIFTCVISFPDQLHMRYEDLFRTNQWLPCWNHIRIVPDCLRQKWLSMLSQQRLKLKSQSTCRVLKERETSREEAFFRTIAFSFGHPNNTVPFQMLASRIPYPLLFELRDSLCDLEAMFFGHSGLLNRGKELGPYAGFLKNRYDELRPFLPTPPLPAFLWQYLRLRPAAFPTVRLAQLASLIHHRLPLGQTLLETSTIVELEQLFRVRAGTFWDSHYRFERMAAPFPKYVGIQSVHTLIINAVVPFMKALGETEQCKRYLDWAEMLLFQVKAESNHIIKNWIKFGVRPRNATESQGLIQLYQHYCSCKRCLECMFGEFILDATADEKLQP